jgi:hypothetical protein
LIVMLKNSKVEIFTDNDQNFLTFQKLKNLNFKITCRQYFKILSNGILWNSIIEIIKLLNLDVTMFKVQAHTNDIYNNYVDQQVSLVHNNID